MKPGLVTLRAEGDLFVALWAVLEPLHACDWLLSLRTFKYVVMATGEEGTRPSCVLHTIAVTLAGPSHKRFASTTLLPFGPLCRRQWRLDASSRGQTGIKVLEDKPTAEGGGRLHVGRNGSILLTHGSPLSLYSTRPPSQHT